LIKLQKFLVVLSLVISNWGTYVVRANASGTRVIDIGKKKKYIEYFIREMLPHSLKCAVDRSVPKYTNLPHACCSSHWFRRNDTDLSTGWYEAFLL